MVCGGSFAVVILKFSRSGSRFGPVLRYLLQPEKGHEIVAGNVPGHDAATLNRELSQWRDLNPNVTKPLFIASLSAAPADLLSTADWRQVARRFVEQMHFADSPWIAVRHRDTDADHIHLVAVRIRHDGKGVDPSHDAWRGLDACRQIEHEMNLSRLPARRELLGRALRRDELAVFEHTGRIRVLSRLQQHVVIAARGDPTASEWVARLEAQGVKVKARIGPDDRVTGISFGLDGMAIKGSNLGRAYSWRGLQQHRGVRYEAGRDLPALAAATARAGTSTSRAPVRHRLPERMPAQQDLVTASLQDDILAAARVLGDDTVKVLSAAAVRAVRAASLAAGRTLGRGLARGLGFGPGDDGLER
jgi:hypothetical protein